MHVFYYIDSKMSSWLIIGIIVILVVVTLVQVYRFVKYENLPYYDEKYLGWEHLPEHKDDEIKHTVILIGDTGAPAILKKDPVLRMLQIHLEKGGEDSTLVVMGDIIYPHGMPPEDSMGRNQAEKRLKTQLDVFNRHQGPVYILSGNHDWNKGKRNGLEYAYRLEEFCTAYTKRDDIFQPTGSCPGPVEIELAEDFTLVLINTQLWVQNGEVPFGSDYGCDTTDEDDFFKKLNEILVRTKDKYTLIAAHHPLYTNGQHGGRFPVKEHIFPLTAKYKRLYVPFPVIGSLYPYYRKYIGAKEDMAHPRYRRLRKRLINLFKLHHKLIYAAGHDHNLQYFQKRDQHYIVSGSGCKTTYVRKGKGAVFTHSHTGFFKVNYLKNDEVWLEVWENDPQEPEQGRMSFKTKLQPRAVKKKKKKSKTA